MPLIAPIIAGDGGLTRGAMGMGFGFHPGTPTGPGRGATAGAILGAVRTMGSASAVAAAAPAPPPTTGPETRGVATGAPIVGEALGTGIRLSPPPGKTLRLGGPAVGAGGATRQLAIDRSVWPQVQDDALDFLVQLKVPTPDDQYAFVVGVAAGIEINRTALGVYKDHRLIGAWI